MFCPRFLKAAVSFTCRKFSMGQISRQGKTLDMAEVRNRLREVVGASTNWQDQQQVLSERSSLCQYLARSQDDLPAKRMKDSLIEAHLPLGSQPALREKYLNSHNSVRFGRILEDLDCLGGVRQKSTVQYISRPDLPKLAYRRVKGKSPGVVFLPGYGSNMSGPKAEALEEFCKSLGHAYLRFDYSGHGASEGVFSEGTIGTWKKDVLFMLDELAEGPQILVGSSMGGWLMLLAAIAHPEKTKALVGISTAADHFVTAFKALPIEVRKECEDKGIWTIPTKSNQEGIYTVNMDFLQEAENHCILQSPIPITCPVRLIHGLKDEDVPWHISMQVAERVLSPDVDIILRRHGQHHMTEKDDIKLIVYTIDDLIDKLTTMV